MGGDGAPTPMESIRLKLIREGLEDYEYLKLLENLVATLQAGDPSTAEELAWISSAQQLLAIPSSLVGSRTIYTRDSAALENYRRQLAAAILTGKRLTLGVPPADHDFDGDVDGADLDSLDVCLTGSQIPQTDPACQWADLDMDGDVDHNDFGIFQRCYSGEDNPADPHCAD